MSQARFPYKNAYGHFSSKGDSYIITRPDTPRPWVNVMSTGSGYGVVMSQTGSGYSWLDHASLNRITRWNQDLIQDNCGRYIYVRDEKTGEFWSVGWKPVQKKPTQYKCVHGVGYTMITSLTNGIEAEWFIFVPHEEPLEIWRLRVRNVSKKERKLTLWTYLEWNLGEGPDWHREFHKTFIETEFYDKKRTILARKRLSSLKNKKGQNWNRTWDWTAWHSVNLPTKDISGDKQAFLGNYGSVHNPEALVKGHYVGKTTHKWDDGIGSLCVPLTLKANEEKTALYTVGAAESESEAIIKSQKFHDYGQVDYAWNKTEMFWDKYISAQPVETPDSGFNLLTNTWLKYQAMSCRIWGRSAYYQTGGACGYRDQLQDSQVFLPMDPERTKKQIRLHAEHQFSDGTVYHWWHPISEEGLPSEYSDDLLWLPFVTVNYLKETYNWKFLLEKVPYCARRGEKKVLEESIYEHGTRSIEKALSRMSRRGLPLIGEADWNDGLSAVGRDWKGESVWMGHFLYGILRSWAEMIQNGVAEKTLPSKEKSRAQKYLTAAKKLKSNINKHAWDGQWFFRATRDDGKVLGSHKRSEGKIFLNAQTWAILNGVVDSPSRQKSILKSLEKYLYGPHGPLLLTPGYTIPDEKVGYLTRYSPSSRENGGIYFHAAVWALQMECFLGRASKAWELYKRMSPILRSTKDVELYRCEPYVTPGNVDGPDSATPGRGGWTWYTGSAAWLYRISTEWFLGVRPDWGGLRVKPCLPPEWKTAEVTRTFRGATYRIRYKRDLKLKAGTKEIVFNNERLKGDLLPVQRGRINDVLVSVGRAL